MNDILKQMFKQYKTNSLIETKNTIKEILQEAVLCSLYYQGFFENVCFCGGTALRIFRGLKRFSEDLDFSLIKNDPNFDLNKYSKAIESDLLLYGINATIDVKNTDSNIKTAWLKSNLQTVMIYFKSDAAVNGIRNNELLRIKIEVYTNPPNGAHIENLSKILPKYYEVNTYDFPTMFAGKINAILSRRSGEDCKGRDLFDFVFYLQNNIKPNLIFLKNALIQFDLLKDNDEFNNDILKQMLVKRFQEIDFEKAKNDVKEFVDDISQVDYWNQERFVKMVDLI